MDAEAWKKRYLQEKSARKAAESVAEDKIRELQQVSRFKSEFLANVSHEFRTPLNSLIILAKLMLENTEGNLTEDDLQSISIIHNNARELLEIIEEILDMSRAKTGDLTLHVENVALRDICLSLGDQFEPLAREKKLSFSIVTENQVPEFINTDKKRLKQILKNLLSNACKFTPKGGEVRLRIYRGVWLPETDYTSECICFEVLDTGIGIPEEKHSSIFQMFRQADGSTTRKFGGTGLGLAVCRKMSDLLDAELVLESCEAQGSVFTLTLPPAALISGEKPQADNDFFRNNLPAGSDDPNRLFKNETILLVDDDLRNSFAFSQLLQKHGLKVLLAENGQQGLELLEEERQIDLVLLDLTMPTMDGFAMLKELRSTGHYQTLPVIMLTASDSAEDEKRCRQAGANDYLHKPVSVSMLLDSMHRWLE